LVILFRHFGFIAPKTYLAFQSFYFDRWTLFQKRFVRTNFDIYVLMNWICLFVCLFSAFQLWGRKPIHQRCGFWFPSLTSIYIAIFDNLSINLKNTMMPHFKTNTTLTTCDGDLDSPTIKIVHHRGILLFTDFEIHYSEKYASFLWN
jgi:hypothetical protein